MNVGPLPRQRSSTGGFRTGKKPIRLRKLKQLEVALANGYEGPRSKRIFKLKEVQY